MKLYLCCAALCLLVFARPAAATSTGQARLAVLGVACTTTDKDWKAGLVGFGLKNWLAQALFDSGRFELVEDRAPLASGVPLAEEVAFDLISKGQSAQLEMLARRLGAQYLAVGQVENMYTRSQGVRLGPLSTASRDCIVRLKVGFYELASGKLKVVEGKGKVGRSSSGFLADFSGNRLPFDPSTVGPATGLAVTEVVEKLLGPSHGRLRPAPASASPRVTVTVCPLGLAPELAKFYPEIVKRRVPLGIHNRIVKAVNGTASCQLVEMNPEVIEAMQLQLWMSARGAQATSAAIELGKAAPSPARWMVYGEVFGFSARDTEKLSGFKGKVAREVTVRVQLRALDLRSGSQAFLVSSGSGTEAGDWEAWQGQEVEWEQTFVGVAAGRAITEAWEKLYPYLMVPSAAPEAPAVVEVVAAPAPAVEPAGPGAPTSVQEAPSPAPAPAPAPATPEPSPVPEPAEPAPAEPAPAGPAPAPAGPRGEEPLPAEPAPARPAPAPEGVGTQWWGADPLRGHA